MDPLFTSKDINLIIKSIGCRIDWLRSERGRHETMIADPVFAAFQTFNLAFENKIHDELIALEELQKRLLVDSRPVMSAGEYTA